MSSDFLADLDAAVDGRCACRCGAPIGPSSPSAYFASERCANRWYGRADFDPNPVARFLAVIEAETVRMFAEVSEFLSRLAKQFGLPPEPPTDLRERALWLRRNRNTGPRRPPVPPRRLEPGAGLRCDARGRPGYRRAR